VTISPRALLGVAPAAIVLVGSFWMSRSSARNELPDDGGGARSELMTGLSLDDQDRLHRVALKEETIDDLVERRVSLAEAVDRFELLAGPVSFLSVPGETRTERAVRQIISYVQKKFAKNPDEIAARLAEIESEARAMRTATH
jgi:hypothetical protein